MDPFAPSRAEAVRIGRERGEALGEQVLPEDSQRRLQPIVNKFFYELRSNSYETQRLGLWWANRMLATARPLEEKLTLFWHGHFATGQGKVRDARMMQQQNVMLRECASGRLRALLMGILTNPAMLVYLDNGENVKQHPNENFGRELLAGISILAVPVGTVIHRAPVRVGRMCLWPMLQAPDTVSGVHIAVQLTGRGLVLGHFSDTSPCLCSFFVRPDPEHPPPVSLPAKARPRSAGASPRTGVGSDGSLPETTRTTARASPSARPS